MSRHSDLQPAPAALDLDRIRRHDVVRVLGEALADADRAVVVIGVSGGADSVALMLAAAALARRRQGPRPVSVVAHVHHHLRSEADAEARHVGRLADELRLPFRRFDVFPVPGPGGLAQAARAARYDALAACARAEDAPLVLVAHHANDQFETMLMQLARGTTAPVGMPLQRRLDERVMLLRPFLEVAPETLRDACDAAGATWCEDPSNESGPRGALRRHVLPTLDERWPGASARAARTARLTRDARDALEHLVLERFGPAEESVWPRERLRDLPPSVVATGLRRAALARRPALADRLGARHLDAASAAVVTSDGAPRIFDWPEGLRVMVTARHVRLEYAEPVRGSSEAAEPRRAGDDP